MHGTRSWALTRRSVATLGRHCAFHDRPAAARERTRGARGSVAEDQRDAMLRAQRRLVEPAAGRGRPLQAIDRERHDELWGAARRRRFEPCDRRRPGQLEPPRRGVGRPAVEHLERTDEVARLELAAQCSGEIRELAATLARLERFERIDERGLQSRRERAVARRAPCFELAAAERDEARGVRRGDILRRARPHVGVDVAERIERGDEAGRQQRDRGVRARLADDRGARDALELVAQRLVAGVRIDAEPLRPAPPGRIERKLRADLSLELAPCACRRAAPRSGRRCRDADAGTRRIVDVVCAGDAVARAVAVLSQSLHGAGHAPLEECEHAARNSRDRGPRLFRRARDAAAVLVPTCTERPQAELGRPECAQRGLGRELLDADRDELARIDRAHAPVGREREPVQMTDDAHARLDRVPRPREQHGLEDFGGGMAPGVERDDRRRAGACREREHRRGDDASPRAAEQAHG